MIVACPSCATRFKVDPARIPAAGAKVRCAKCGHVWLCRSPVEPAPAPSLLLGEPAPKPEPETAEAARMPQPEEGFPFPQRHAEPQRAQAHTRALPSEPRARVIVSEEKRKRFSLGPWALRAGWSALAALVILGLGLGYALRLNIVRAYPKSEALYSLLGLEVNVIGIDFRNVTAATGFSDGKPSLELQGEIVNKSRRRVAVPGLRASLRDEKGRELKHFSFEALAESLGPKEVSAFSSPPMPLPQGTKELELRFAPAK